MVSFRQNISSAPDRVDQGASGPAIQLFSQVIDVDIHHVGAAIKVDIPHVVCQRGPGDQTIFMAQEIFQNGKVNRRRMEKMRETRWKIARMTKGKVTCAGRRRFL